MFIPQTVLNFHSVLRAFEDVAQRPLISEIPVKYMRMLSVYKTWFGTYAKVAQERARIELNVAQLGKGKR